MKITTTDAFRSLARLEKVIEYNNGLVRKPNGIEEIDTLMEFIKEVADLEKQLAEAKSETSHYQQLCFRTKVILDDEEFWDKTSTDKGWHSSLHKDLTKASKKEYKDAILEKALDVMSLLQEELKQLKAEQSEVVRVFKGDAIDVATKLKSFFNFEYDEDTVTVTIKKGE